MDASRSSPYKSFRGEPHPATYISLVRAMSLRHPQLQKILENQVFCFLTGQVGQSNQMASAVMKKEVEWVWVGHLAAFASQGDIRVQVILENQGLLRREKQYKNLKSVLKNPLGCAKSHTDGDGG